MNLSFLTAEEAQRLLNKTNLTKEDSFLLASYPFVSLVEYCNDIRSNEIEKVQDLEYKNIENFLRSATHLFGMWGVDKLRRIITLDPFPDIIKEIKEEFDSVEEQNLMFVYVGVRVLLHAFSNSKTNDFTQFGIQGQMPQKMFAFRQSTADDWFQKFVTNKMVSFKLINEKLGFEEAKNFFLISIAFSIYKFQPHRFNISSYNNIEDAIHKILLNFVSGDNDMAEVNFNQRGEILFKDL